VNLAPGGQLLRKKKTRGLGQEQYEAPEGDYKRGKERENWRTRFDPILWEGGEGLTNSSESHTQKREKRVRLRRAAHTRVGIFSQRTRGRRR